MEKQAAMDGFVKKEKELQDAYAERVRGLEQIEFGLVKRKEQLDIERFEISKEREKCETDKQELAENLAKFNQLVEDFTSGVDRFSDNN
jgi:DNA-binding ferritin-like protein